MTRSQKHEIEQRGIIILSSYGWPGNVRQLRHVVEQLVATSEGEMIAIDDTHRALGGATLAATTQVPVIVCAPGRVLPRRLND
jgi:DNA-binding NtrC family response regulator